MPRAKAVIQSHERFPAKPRNDGRFQKRILGRLFYFGSGGDRKTALEEYSRVKDDLYAGRWGDAATARDRVGITLGQLVSDYLEHLAAENASGRVSDIHLSQSEIALVRFLKWAGISRAVDDLRPSDFAGYGRYLTGKLGDYAYNRERAIIGAMFNHASEYDWIEHPVKIGRGFRRIGAARLREQRKRKLVEPRHLASLLGFASQYHRQLEAMLLLAANAGFGATDCGQLTWDKVDLDGAAIRHYRRPKTLIDRDAPLWPETVEALRVLRADRPDDTHVFRTAHFDSLWKNTAVTHAIADMVVEFNVVRADVGLEPIEFVLGDLRHTFATYASEANDGDAWKRVMGHRLGGLRDTYIETLFMPRLRAMVQHVRQRLFF